MNGRSNIAPILMADDDKDDLMMTERALKENRVANPFVAVPDGEQLLDYLRRLRCILQRMRVRRWAM